MLMPSLSDYGDAYIFVKGTITVDDSLAEVPPHIILTKK